MNIYKNRAFRIFLALTGLLLFSGNFGKGFVDTTDSRIRTLVYSAYDVFALKFDYRYQSYIEFPEDEKIFRIAVGDEYAWDISPSQSKNLLFIKPTHRNAKTNMTVFTTYKQGNVVRTRPYQFDLISSNKSGSVVDDDIVYVVRFYYPDRSSFGKELLDQSIANPPVTGQDTFMTRQGSASAKNLLPSYRPGDIYYAVPGSVEEARIRESLASANNTNYTMAGSVVDNNMADFYPLAVYDNGKSTFFEFKNARNIPQINILAADGSEQRASLKANGPTSFEAPYVIARYTLRYSDGSTLCIFNEPLIQQSSVAQGENNMQGSGDYDSYFD